MSAVWPERRQQMLGLRVRLTRRLCNHDGPVQAGTSGEITVTNSLFSFQMLTDACDCCGMRRKVTYVNRSDVELLA